MALNQKRTVVSGKFKPSRPVKVLDERTTKTQRWSNFNDWLPTIQWAELNEEEFKSQWGNCLNALNALVSDKVISTDDLWPVFDRYLKLKGYSEDEKKRIKSEKRETYINFSILSKAYVLMVGNVDNKHCIATDTWITAKLKAYLAKPFVEEEVANKRTADERTRDKFSELLGDLYAFEDAFEEVDIAAFLSERNVAKDLLQVIEERFRPRMLELAEAMRGKDPQLVEAYSSYSKRELKAMHAWYEALLAGVETYRGAKVVRASAPRAERAPRARKEKPPEKVVKNVKVLVERSDELGIVSLPAKNLVGCDAVYLYSLKYKRLVVYFAEDGKQITISGAHFENWDPKTSFQKVLKNPAAQLKEFMAIPGKAGSKSWATGGIKTTAHPNRAGVMAESLILKVYK